MSPHFKSRSRCSVCWIAVYLLPSPFPVLFYPIPLRTCQYSIRNEQMPYRPTHPIWQACWAGNRNVVCVRGPDRIEQLWPHLQACDRQETA